MVPNDESRPIAFAPLPARRPPSRARPSSRATSAHLDVDGRRESSGPKVDAKKKSPSETWTRDDEARADSSGTARETTTTQTTMMTTATTMAHAATATARLSSKASAARKGGKVSLASRAVKRDVRVEGTWKTTTATRVKNLKPAATGRPMDGGTTRRWGGMDDRTTR